MDVIKKNDKVVEIDFTTEETTMALLSAMEKKGIDSKGAWMMIVTNGPPDIHSLKGHGSIARIYLKKVEGHG